VVLEKKEIPIDTPEDECRDLIEKLYEGKIASHPLVKRHIYRALITGNCSQLIEFIERYKVFKAQAERNIELEYYEKLDNPFKPYPSRADALEYLSGPIKFGYINEFNDIFGTHWDTFCLPTIIPGRVRSGKSQLIKYVLCQLLRRPRPFNIIIPDLKREYRHLLSVIKHLKVLLNKWILINVLAVPDWMTPIEYAAFVSKVFVSENYLGGTSENVLFSSIINLYRKNGIFNNGTNYPTLIDLYNLFSDELKTQKSFKYKDIFLWL